MSGWSLAQVRRLFRIVNGGTPTTDPINWDGGVRWATPVDLARVDGEFVDETQRHLTTAGLVSGSRSVPAGSLILSTRAPIGYVAQNTREMAFNQGCRGLVPAMNMDIRYFRYQLSALRDDLQSLGAGSTFQELSTEALATMRLTNPDIVTQRAIADFLDTETTRIDALIEKKRRMIEVLSERFAAHVEKKTYASVIGVAKNDPLPDGWRSVVLRRCFRSIQYGIGEASQQAGKIAVLGMGNVDQGEIVGSPGGFVENTDPSLLLEPGDLLFNRTNSLALVGKVALVRSNMATTATTFASYLVRLRTNQLADSAYLNYLLNTQAILRLARSMALPSIGQANLNPSRYTSIHIPLPPVQTQRSIARELDLEATNSGKLSTALRRQIELLTEHRQALITAAVTGQLQVPGVAAS